MLVWAFGEFYDNLRKSQNEFLAVLDDKMFVERIFYCLKYLDDGVKMTRSQNF